MSLCDIHPSPCDGEQDNYPLENREIRNKFDEALKSAEKEIDIFCPWISPKVVDETMKDKFRRLLEKKVVIKIRYGIGNLSNGNNTNRNDKTQQYAQELQKEFKMYPNFKMLLDNSHAKLFICDDKFYVISSFNILSFKGDYDGQDMRRELGEYSTNKQKSGCAPYQTGQQKQGVALYSHIVPPD